MLCIHIWNCINTRNLGKLQEKLTFMKFLYADKTDLYMQFMSNYMTWSVYLGSVYDNPEGIEAVGQVDTDSEYSDGGYSTAEDLKDKEYLPY